MRKFMRHHFARIDGVRVHWVELGDACGAPPIVLLHGLNDCYRTWRSVASALARDRRVLIPDLPGHGLSARPNAGYELRWYARVMARWLESRGLDHVDLVGHSFGGGVAQMMLLECHARIRRLVLLAAGGLGREIAMCLRLAAIPWVVERLGQPFMGPATRLAVRATGDVLARDDLARLVAINAQPGRARAFARTVRDIIGWRGQRRGFLQRAREIPALPPIAVVWGARDSIIPAAHAFAFERSVADVHVHVLDGCGHYVHHEKPEAFVSVVRSFLDAQTARRARLRDDASPAGSADGATSRSRSCEVGAA
jgi:pimeloyl-ACP methyl ester carboxylesterase